MTQLLQQTITEIQKLSDEEQDAIARKIDEMLDELRWDMAFANSQDLLKQLGDEATADYLAGRTKPLEFE